MTARVVLIMGASSDLGRATAHLLAAVGDHLVLCSRGKAALEVTESECVAHGAASFTVTPVDVKDRVGVNRVVEQSLSTRGRIDPVVRTAGVIAYGRFEENPADVVDGVVNTNLHGAANVARAVLPVFRRQLRGSLVLVAPSAGSWPGRTVMCPACT